ncbi:MAG TPA: ferrous iron transporter B [Pseudomonas sabulinigri]|uniref:Scaffold protein FimL second domain-containing protein n=1 Tax=marine sediment metagenome TaxID=412755 RepID=A0A0F9V671_9ZZZZ|nr:ferrous iron transporter B [Halopseudomonas sabulinigri]HEC53278.1 ferrous iron transporter B [Halopseudomonas sabulinigri]|tara:strand:+ start:2257 stop:3930 length:1674 start_codon:yes stop_codon:yes gene_type:complete
MLTGTTSLDLVRDELFASMGEVEDLLQQFLDDRQNGNLLQQSIEGLQQLRGTLALIELKGAAEMLDEMISLATDIPTHDGDERNEQLSALCDSLFLLERYLDQARQSGRERPELLLPTINQLRAHRPGVPALPQSHFYPLPVAGLPANFRSGSQDSMDTKVFNRLRQMYQLGLLGLIREDGLAAATPLMQRALQRFESCLGPHTATLCWVAGAALEAIEQTPLALTAPRKRLFSMLDREIKRAAQGSVDSVNALLMHELLYLVALADGNCSRSQEVVQAYQLPDPGFTELEIENAFGRLRGPGVDVMHSVAEALREEITAIKDLLDLLARNAGDAEQSLETLCTGLERLWKTLGMLDLHAEAKAIQAVCGQIAGWSGEQPQSLETLEHVADAVLRAETAVNYLDAHAEEGESGASGPDGFSEPLELKEARIVLIEESQAGLALAKRAITAYMESGNDAMHLLNVPPSLETVRGGLVFLGMSRAASVIHMAASFIRETMLERKQVPKDQQLEVLADALTSIEFYLESAERAAVATGDVLTLAEESLAELGYAVSEAKS